MALLAALPVKLAKARERGHEGLTDPSKAHRKRPIAEHISDWCDELGQMSRATKYIANGNAALCRLASDCGWATLDAIEPAGFIRWRQTAKAKI